MSRELDRLWLRLSEMVGAGADVWFVETDGPDRPTAIIAGSWPKLSAEDKSALDDAIETRITESEKAGASKDRHRWTSSASRSIKPGARTRMQRIRAPTTRRAAHYAIRASNTSLTQSFRSLASSCHRCVAICCIALPLTMRSKRSNWLY